VLCVHTVINCLSYSAHYDPDLPCECNDKCAQYGNCCPDYDDECDGGAGGSLSNEDLIVLSEMLISDDTNNVGGKIQLNLQCTTNNGNPQVICPQASSLYIVAYLSLSGLFRCSSLHKC
jgi:hypothetical protein